MISYIHAPVIALCFFLLLSMWRFWACIDRLGFTREVSRRAPSMAQGDMLAATLAIMPFLVAAVDWFGITLPRQSAPIPPYAAAFISMACLGGCMFILRNSGERFAGHWAGTRESALRTVAALRMKDLARGLRWMLTPDAPLYLKPRLDPVLWRWLAQSQTSV